jgi:LPXTG-site transpeptidase (sortase) family protein
VDSTGDVGQNTSLALNSSGFPVISYYDATNKDLKVAVCGDATCATKTITPVDGNVVGNLKDVGQFTSLALKSGNIPVISYYDATNGDLKVAVCVDTTCTTKTTTTVDNSTDNVGQYTSLALNSSGFPVISYYDVTNKVLKVAVCVDATCTTATTPKTVDSAGDVGKYTSLALNSSGFPVISYYDATNGDLKLAVCTDATCTAPILTPVDSTGNVGYFTSLKLNSSGFPVISYTDASNFDLKLAVCGNATCTAPILTTVDSTGMVGLDTSLELNSSGAPVISYYDAGNGDLKLAFVTPLTVGSTSILSTYPTTGPSSFTVTFSENVNNPTGDTDAEDVTNPANYWVVNKGPNGVVDTVSCSAGLAGDDTKATVSGVIYTPNTAVVTLASALPVGSYRLFVCGTTSIVDLLLNPLGNGVDYTSDFTVGTTTGTSVGTVTANSLPRTGFAPNVVTVLPAQPEKHAYSKLGSLWLEVPSLKIKTNIVGVPQSENTWDVKWLGQDAGWLNGTAFPSWEGNSVVTGHAIDANGLPGPFANIKNLKYGDQIIVHMSGEQYIFEVRNSRLARPYSTKFAFEHLEEHSYLTLITCQGYNPISNSYLFRRIIRAVLVDVK